MKLVQLQQLSALYEYGTFSRAAQALYMSQPSLSVSIRELEEELGVQLVIRGNRGILFTPVGQAVLTQAQQVLLEIKEIYHICEDVRLSGTLHLASTPHYCTSILLETKLELEQMYPSVSVQLEENDSGTIWKKVENGTLDAGLIQLCDLDEASLMSSVAAGSIQFLELFEEPMCVAVSDLHPLAQKNKVEPAELLRYPYGAYKNALNTWVASLLKEQSSSDCRVFHVNDIDPLRILLVREKAFTIIPTRSIQYGNAMYLSKLTPLDLHGPVLTTKVGMVFKTKNQTNLLNALIAVLETHCNRYQADQ